MLYEVVYAYNVNFWEGNSGQFIEVFVFRHDEDGVACYCAIHEFVVVDIRFYQSETIMWVNELYVWQHLEICQDYSCSLWTDVACYHFLILFKYFIGNTEHKFSLYKPLPDLRVDATG